MKNFKKSRVGQHLLDVLGDAITSSMEPFQKKQHSQPAVRGTEQITTTNYLSVELGWFESAGPWLMTIGTNYF